MLMLMPLQQFCECESRIWVCRGCVSVWVMPVWVECEWECECAGRFNVSSRAQHLQNVFCLRLKVCYKKYFMTCKSINKKVQLHPHTPPPLPTLFCWPCSVYFQRWRCRCGRALSFARLVTHFVFWVMFHVFPPQLFPFRILLLCWPFGSSFYGKLHLSMC